MVRWLATGSALASLRRRGSDGPMTSSRVTLAALRRRDLLIGGGLLLASLQGPALAAPAQALTVYKSPTCGCCSGWIAHARRAGFVPRVVDVDDLLPVKARLGVPEALMSCHTSVVGGRVFEGHVPLEEVRRFLAKPQGVGLAVPGMPSGSPGMERPDGAVEPYEVLAFDKQGRTRVFARRG